MAEQLANTIVGFFQDRIPEELIVFAISLLPILELRGGLIAASLLGVDLKLAFVISYAANMLPMPFILLFIRKVFKFLRNKRFFGEIIRKLEERSDRKSETVKKYGKWGLLIFVAIPLPGTGGWTGALVAALMNMRIKHAIGPIAVGVFIAGIIMAIISYGIPALVQ